MKNIVLSTFLVTVIVCAILVTGGCEKRQTVYYQCLTERDVAEGVKAYAVTIPEAGTIKNPGLMFLVRGLGDKAPGF